MLKIQREDQHGNVVAVEGCTTCICGCKYWENDKCIDCGMTPERLWIIQQGERSRALFDMSLNVKFTTMLHYDLPWLDTHVSDEYDAVNVSNRITALPDRHLVWARDTDCNECGGSDNNHYLNCSVWGF